MIRKTSVEWRSDTVEPPDAPAVRVVAAAVEPLAVVLHDPDWPEALGAERRRPGEDRALPQQLRHERGPGGLGVVVLVGAVHDEEPPPGPGHRHVEDPPLLGQRYPLTPGREQIRELVGDRVGEPAAVPVGQYEHVVGLEPLGRVRRKEPHRPHVPPVAGVLVPPAVDDVHRSRLGPVPQVEGELPAPVSEGVHVRPGPADDEDRLPEIDEVQTVGDRPRDVPVRVHRQQLRRPERRVLDTPDLLPLLHRVRRHEPAREVHDGLRAAIGGLDPGHGHRAIPSPDSLEVVELPHVAAAEGVDALPVVTHAEERETGPVPDRPQ